MPATPGNPSNSGDHGASAGNATGESHGGAPSTGGGAGHANPALAAMFAERAIVTNRLMKSYAAALCGLIAIFVLFHWARWLSMRTERSLNRDKSSILGRPFVTVTRLIRNVLVRKVPGFKSAGHALLVLVYSAINLAIMLTNVDLSVMGNVAARFGWVAFGNLAFVIFLSLKNTPLAFLTAYSYERLNCLHQIAGYTMFVQLVLHASLYTSFFKSQGRLLSIFAEREQIAAIVAGFAFLSAILSATFLRRWWYELFYVVHIGSWITAIVCVGLHQPEFAKGLVVTVFAVSLWGSDRILRASRVLYYSINNEATLHPLPNGGTKIVMKKVPGRAEPGKHCFVWIPAIRRFETHPFTIHKSSPVEFTVKAHNGFTRDLHSYAVANPGAAVKASIDGPYGTFPDPMEFDKIVLIAGGGGATFTFGLAVNVLERMKDEAPKNIVFIWSVREHENLSWFKEQLETLKTHAHSPKVNVSLYVTRSPASPPHTHGHDARAARPTSIQSSEGEESPPLSPATDVGKTAPQLPVPQRQALAERDLEKEMEQVIETRVEHPVSDKDGAAATTTISQASHHPIKAGRPDVGFLIRDAVTTTPSNQRVLVAACGPDGLMRVVRDTTAKLIRGDGPGVELHCEQFGW
ncbi:ferric reductase NAD binding domain-containing protein [Lasiosphaeris hirsuta]|uniref:Ferric reductase NAD binding domain-containing protein n=1 Tax=Lasiosphaeris hirsuta TaxID=260670 RepID=A0AA40A1N7_9PEZI|nr:ferric reductase NAD binding domain-containing protein [Lasiosphaeris hirsuta]